MSSHEAAIRSLVFQERACLASFLRRDIGCAQLVPPSNGFTYDVLHGLVNLYPGGKLN